MERPSFKDIRVLIWIYFWLLIWEGALRKWVLPSLSSPLLLIRDPVVCAIYALAMGKGVFPLNGIVKAAFALAFLTFFASFFVFNSVPVMLFGLHADFLHLPLIFIIPKVFTQHDVLRMGRWFMLLSIPMALLVVVQFASPAGAKINAAAGGDAGQIISSGERIRPPGLFSFVSGMIPFLGVVAAFLFNGFLNKRLLPARLRLATVPALIISLVVSGSRSAIAGVTLILAAVVIISLRRFSRLKHLLVPIIVGYLIFLGLCYFPLFREGVDVNQSRFGEGGGVQEGLVDRYFGTLIEAIQTAARTPPLGYGLGMGTNAGATLLTGSRVFLLAESEWSRVIAESGPILGFAYIFLRLAICWILIQKSWAALGRGEPLPLLLAAACLSNMLSGQFGQPTTLGFAVLTAGLSLAAANAQHLPKILSAPKKPRRIQGRSQIARRVVEVRTPNSECRSDESTNDEVRMTN